MPPSHSQLACHVQIEEEHAFRRAMQAAWQHLCIGCTTPPSSMPSSHEPGGVRRYIGMARVLSGSADPEAAMDARRLHVLADVQKRLYSGLERSAYRASCVERSANVTHDNFKQPSVRMCEARSGVAGLWGLPAPSLPAMEHSIKFAKAQSSSANSATSSKVQASSSADAADRTDSDDAAASMQKAATLQPTGPDQDASLHLQHRAGMTQQSKQRRGDVLLWMLSCVCKRLLHEERRSQRICAAQTAAPAAEPRRKREGITPLVAAALASALCHSSGSKVHFGLVGRQPCLLPAHGGPGGVMQQVRAHLGPAAADDSTVQLTLRMLARRAAWQAPLTCAQDWPCGESWHDSLAKLMAPGDDTGHRLLAQLVRAPMNRSEDACWRREHVMIIAAACRKHGLDVANVAEQFSRRNSESTSTWLGASVAKLLRGDLWGAQ
jgi:hypothetical protein